MGAVNAGRSQLQTMLLFFVERINIISWWRLKTLWIWHDLGETFTDFFVWETFSQGESVFFGDSNANSMDLQHPPSTYEKVNVTTLSLCVEDPGIFNKIKWDQQKRWLRQN